MANIKVVEPDIYARMVSNHTFEGYAFLHNRVDPAGLKFSEHTVIGDLHIGMPIHYIFRSVVPGAAPAARPQARSIQIKLAELVNWKRNEYGLWCRGAFVYNQVTEPVIEGIRSLLDPREPYMGLTATTIRDQVRYEESDKPGLLAHYPIVQMALYNLPEPPYAD